MKKFRRILAVLAIAMFTFTACSVEGQDKMIMHLVMQKKKQKPKMANIKLEFLYQL